MVQSPRKTRLAKRRRGGLGCRALKTSQTDGPTMPTKPPFDQLFGTLYCVVINRDGKLDVHIGIALSLARAFKRAEYYNTCCRDSGCEAVVRRMSVEVH